MTAAAFPALVVLIGAAGSGKSTWARAYYQPHQIVSLDALRATVADDENDQAATADALVVLHAILAARMSRRLTTVVDATNGVPAERAELLAHAFRHQVPAVAIVVDTPLQVCLARQADRPGPAPGRRWGRAVPASVVTNQHARTRASTVEVLTAEGFAIVLQSPPYAPRGIGTCGPVPEVESIMTTLAGSRRALPGTPGFSLQPFE